MTSHDQKGDHGVSIPWGEFHALWDRMGGRASARSRSRTDMAAGGLWLGALFVVFITWNGAAGRTSVGAQVPYLVSGVLAALFLAVAGSVVFLLGVASGAAGDRPDEPDGEEGRR